MGLGMATDLGGLLPIIKLGLPTNNSPLCFGEDYVLPERWSSDIAWDHEAALVCQPSDRLTIVAWDLS